MEDTLQDALKVQSSLRKGVGQLITMSYKIYTGACDLVLPRPPVGIVDDVSVARESDERMMKEPSCLFHSIHAWSAETPKRG